MWRDERATCMVRPSDLCALCVLCVRQLSILPLLTQRATLGVAAFEFIQRSE